MYDLDTTGKFSCLILIFSFMQIVFFGAEFQNFILFFILYMMVALWKRLNFIRRPLLSDSRCMEVNNYVQITQFTSGTFYF